jgi:hypothetical protein
MLRNNKKLGISITILALLFVMFSGIENAKAQGSVSINLFYDALRPHGSWFNYGNYGLCWKPYHIDRDWRPYTNGHWIWTDYGWTWASDYAWGWAPFHYGRWIFDDWDGWIWVPDDEWGPAWVEWRYSDDYIGWAPLPPHVRMSHHIGYDHDDYGINYIHWSFVPCRSFLDIHINFVPFHKSYGIFHRTKNITNITYIDNRVYNYGPKLHDIERSSGRRITEYRVVEDRNLRSDRNYSVENNNLKIYRPDNSRTTGSTRTGNETRNAVTPNNTRTSTSDQAIRTENNNTNNRNSGRNINSNRNNQTQEKIEKREESRNNSSKESYNNNDRNRKSNISSESKSTENRSTENKSKIEKREEKRERSNESREKSNDSKERSSSRSDRDKESRERR